MGFDGNVRRLLLAFVLLLALVLVAAPATPQVPGNFPAGLPPSPATDVERTETTLAPGVTLERFIRVTGSDRTRISVLRADLSRPTVTADLLYPGVVARRRQLTAMATDAGAIGAVNGDFFDIENDPSDARLRSDAPAGTAIAGGELLKSFDPVSETEGRKTALLGADEAGRVGDAGFAGTLALPGGPAPLDGFNRIRVLDGQVGAYNGRWGPYTRARVVDGASEVRTVLVRDGRVAEVRDSTRAGQLDAGSFELVGRGAGARRLAGLEPGTTVGTTAAATFQGIARTPLFAVGGVAYLVRGGQITDDGAPADLDRRGPYPRVAIGFGSGGRTLLLVVADGRQATSSGFLRTIDFAQLLKDLGAEEALHLDGGGSATMAARQPSRDRVEVVNSPSDGAEGTGVGGLERAVPNGIGIFYDAAGRPGQPARNGAALRSGKFLGARFVAGFARPRLRARPGRRASLPLYVSRRARVRVTVHRRGRVRARFAARVGAGPARVRLRRRLGPGRYVLRLRARTQSGRRATDRAVLRVVRRRR